MAFVVVPLFDVALPAGDGWYCFHSFSSRLLINAELNFGRRRRLFFGSESNWGLMSFKRNVLMSPVNYWCLCTFSKRG